MTKLDQVETLKKLTKLKSGQNGQMDKIETNGQIVKKEKIVRCEKKRTKKKHKNWKKHKN